MFYMYMYMFMVGSPQQKLVSDMLLFWHSWFQYTG